jgi:hypothetical protein
MYLLSSKRLFLFQAEFPTTETHLPRQQVLGVMVYQLQNDPRRRRMGQVMIVNDGGELDERKSCKRTEDRDLGQIIDD